MSLAVDEAVFGIEVVTNFNSFWVLGAESRPGSSLKMTDEFARLA